MRIYNYILILILFCIYVGCKHTNQIELEAAIDQFEYLNKQTPIQMDQFEIVKIKFENLSYSTKHEIQTRALYYLSEISLIQNKLHESYEFICQAYDSNHADSIYRQKQKIEFLLLPKPTSNDTLVVDEKNELNHIIEISRAEINILYENKNYDGAINQTNMLISIIKNLNSEEEIKTELSQLYQDLAIFYSQKNNLEQAKKFIDKAVALNPTPQNEEIQKLIDNKL